MGCKRANKIYFGKNIEQFKKTLTILLTVTMFTLVFITPVVFGGPHADYIEVTFTPTGDISLDVTKGTATFGSEPAGTVNASPSEGATSAAYTLYNNGSVAAHVYMFSNGTTNGTAAQRWTLDIDGTPGLDNFCLKRWNNSAVFGLVYVKATNVSSSFISSLAGGGTTKLFGLTLQLGNSSASTHLVAQHTRINITGVAA